MPTDAPRLTDFAGRWSLERVIDDALAGERLTAAGQAVFVQDSGGLVYDEETELTLSDGRRLTGRRRYLWRAEPAGGIAVLFEDGRLFHRIAPGTARPEDSHVCTPDFYRGAYDFGRWPEFTVRWHVKGPRKDYRMDTLFRPAP